MLKRFKFRISRFIPSFQTCRSSNDPCSPPSHPVPSFLSLTPLNPKLIGFHFSAAPSSESHHTSLTRHVPSAFISVGCGFKSRDTISDDDPANGFRWQKEDKWHVVAKVLEETPPRKIYNSSISGGSDSDGDDFLPLPPLPRLTKLKGRVRKKKTTSTVRISTSSADSCGMFGSDGYDERNIEEAETETLVSSSRSFYTDSSSEFNPHLETIGENSTNYGQRKRPKQKKKKKKKVNRRVSAGTMRKSVSSPECQSPARPSMFQWLIPFRAEGKVGESFAIVKKSEDPYDDFKRSMMEMILEKQMFEDQDLEQLLHCFLSLNSSEHHAVIVEAFTEIWEALYICKTD